MPGVRREVSVSPRLNNACLIDIPSCLVFSLL